MQDIDGQLTDLRRKVLVQSYVTSAENTLADDLLRLIEIVSCINNRLDRVDSASRSAANVSSCLVNGMQPD